MNTKGGKILNGIGSRIHFTIPNVKSNQHIGFIEEGQFSNGILIKGRTLKSDGKSQCIPLSSEYLKWDDYIIKGKDKLDEAEKYESLRKIILHEKA